MANYGVYVCTHLCACGVSPYHWGYYPHFWHPWSPISYNVYYGYHRPYYHYYRRTYTYRSPAAHAYYTPHRVSSVYVIKSIPHPGPNHCHGQPSGNLIHVHNPRTSIRLKRFIPPNNQSGIHDIHQIPNQNINRPTEKIHQTPNSEQ